MSKTKGLVIVESPAKAKTINKFLNNAFYVESSVGHIIDLPKSKLGVDIDNGFVPEYVKMPGKSAIINKLKSAAKKANAVFIATDPDREGEAIAYHIKNVLEKSNANIKRVEFNEITQKAVQSAIENPRNIDNDRVMAQQARRVLDRIVGYQVSPFLWKTVYKGLSAGRVQSVALRLVCEKEMDISKFVPEEYWTITGDFVTPHDEFFTTKLTKIDGKKAKLTNAAQAEKAINGINAAAFAISEIKIKKNKRHPFPPFTTSTLQQVAYRQLGMSGKRAMMNAQQLYEGIEVGGETVGLITYMRTDSLRISSEAIGDVRSLIVNSYGDDYLPEKPNFYKTKKSAQDAHEAVRPTQISDKYSPKKLKKYLNRDQSRLYELIWNRFVSSQMVPALIEKTSVIVTGKPYQFQADGEVIRFRGFLQVFDDKEDENGSEDKPVNLPARLEEGMKLDLKEAKSKQLFTLPPARYTESSLVKILDQLGIGRPSTYAQIISTILQRTYVQTKEKKLHATDLGMTVNTILTSNFPDIFNVEFTAFMEMELDKIAEGDLSYLEAMEYFIEPFTLAMEKAHSNRQTIKASIQKESGEKCEKCGKPMLFKWGRNGKFLACSGFPECKNTMPLEEDKAKRTDHICPTCNSPMLLRKGKYGEFLACSKYPECKTTMAIPTGVKCPKENCDGDIVKKQSRRGKIFYGCSNYPKCDFATWDMPVDKPCPNCENKYLLEKNTQSRGHHFRCPKCKTTFNADEITHEDTA